MMPSREEARYDLGAVVRLCDIPTLAGAGALRSDLVDMLAFLDANLGPPTSPLEGSTRESHEARADAGPSMEIGFAVTREGASLFAQATAQPRAQIFPEADTDFFYRVVDAQITFDVDADGTVNGLVLHQGGHTLAGRNVE